MTIFSCFCQIDRPLGRSLQLEVGIEGATGRAVQRNSGLIAGTAHIPQAISGICGGGDILSGPKYSGFGNIPGLVDIQGIAALIKLCAVSIGKRKVTQNAVGIVDTGFLPGQGNGGSCATGGTGERRYLQRSLHIGSEGIIIGCKITDCGYTCIIENIACGAAYPISSATSWSVRF